ncbi:hypothetical protein BDP27DRAFT_1367239 [Rhodocollybia butyracea]|uniref:Uncharacterized protein n=1 Tax=Rhodocollybia butyracea TaxID=206335 RepID=A0A9P5PJL4_9AGAR|nr:hypothetical protein BDP27DRAFT_1367239 [Rhodocollybia butyracea]
MQDTNELKLTIAQSFNISTIWQSLDMTASQMHTHVLPKAVGTQAGPRDTNSLYNNRWISMWLRNSSMAGNLGAGWEYRGQVVLTLLTRTRANVSQMGRYHTFSLEVPSVDELGGLDEITTVDFAFVLLQEGLQRRISLWRPRRDNSPDLTKSQCPHTPARASNLIDPVLYLRFYVVIDPCPGSLLHQVSTVKYHGFGQMTSTVFSANHQLWTSKRIRIFECSHILRIVSATKGPAPTDAPKKLLFSPWVSKQF